MHFRANPGPTNTYVEKIFFLKKTCFESFGDPGLKTTEIDAPGARFERLWILAFQMTQIDFTEDRFEQFWASGLKVIEINLPGHRFEPF